MLRNSLYLAGLATLLSCGPKKVDVSNVSETPRHSMFCRRSGYLTVYTLAADICLAPSKSAWFSSHGVSNTSDSERFRRSQFISRGETYLGPYLSTHNAKWPDYGEMPEQETRDQFLYNFEGAPDGIARLNITRKKDEAGNMFAECLLDRDADGRDNFYVASYSLPEGQVKELFVGDTKTSGSLYVCGGEGFQEIVDDVYVEEGKLQKTVENSFIATELGLAKNSSD